jgi:hypothetical protein
VIPADEPYTPIYTPIGASRLPTRPPSSRALPRLSSARSMGRPAPPHYHAM